MSLTVERRDSLDGWDDLLARSPHATPFHLADALRVTADHADATLHALVGYKGDQPVGLLPVFEQRRGPFTLATSPPPGLDVDYLGPALLDTAQLKRRRLDKRNKRFVDACLDWLDDAVAPDYVHVRTGARYEDPRPFDWRDFDVRTNYTYELDLSPGADALFERFSGDARTRIRDVRDGDHDVDVSLGDAADVRRIVDQLEARLADVGVTDVVSADFAVDLHDALPDGVVRPYVCRVDGAFAGGVLALESHGTTYGWRGGAKTDGDVDCNDYLDWSIITDAVERGVDSYDLVGAETPRLCWYKSKFGPDLATFHVAERATLPASLAATVYQRLR